MKQKLFAICLVLFLTFGLVTGVSAQAYYFSLDKEVVNVFWNSDGTMMLDYQITFSNSSGGHVIDMVDVGAPNSNFSNVSAYVNGSPLSISSEFLGEGGSGFSVDMGSYAIQPGQNGTLHVVIGTVEGVIHKDDNDEAYASAVFSPSWFGPQYVYGVTDLTVIYHMPPGVQPSEPRWHAAPDGFPSEPQTGIDEQGRVMYTWSNPAASGSTQYLFGASFPQSYVPETAIVTAPPFDLTGLIEGLIGNMFNILCCGFFAFMFVGMPIITAVQGNKRKMQYLPPKVSIEGHGIKRGLTAVEAAILMEEPLDKVMTMILFGVVKKGVAEVVTREPLQLKSIGDRAKTELHEYETHFMEAFDEKDIKERRKGLETMTVSLVRAVSEKMKGFSRKETIEYYKRIMETAWAQVQKANTPEMQMAFFDQQLEWTMLDREYDDRSRRVFHGPVFVPMWWGSYDPTYRSRPTSGGISSPLQGQRSGSGSLPGADFAASVVGGVQTFSQKVIGNVSTFTEKITGVTNPPPKPTSSGRSGGGRSSGGCACACACAGCACACAGGGR
ncbi:MAG: hypothetical protein HZB50_17865 [Chloroflexi bacterium]|nr:hypothetical protein [Chloroflexota bacterium]